MILTTWVTLKRCCSRATTININIQLITFCSLQVPAAFPNSVFAGTKITAEALVQTLKFEEPTEIPTSQHIKKGTRENEYK